MLKSGRAGPECEIPGPLIITSRSARMFGDMADAEFIAEHGKPPAAGVFVTIGQGQRLHSSADRHFVRRDLEGGRRCRLLPSLDVVRVEGRLLQETIDRHRRAPHKRPPRLKVTPSKWPSLGVLQSRAPPEWC